MLRPASTIKTAITAITTAGCYEKSAAASATARASPFPHPWRLGKRGIGKLAVDKGLHEMPEQIGCKQNDDTADDAASDAIHHRLPGGHRIGSDANHAPQPDSCQRDDDRPDAAVKQHCCHAALCKETRFSLMQRTDRNRGDGEHFRQYQRVDAEPKQPGEAGDPQHPKQHEIKRQRPGCRRTAACTVCRSRPNSLGGNQKQSDTKNIGNEIARCTGKAERRQYLDDGPSEGEIDDENRRAPEPEKRFGARDLAFTIGPWKRHQSNQQPSKRNNKARGHQRNRHGDRHRLTDRRPVQHKKRYESCNHEDDSRYEAIEQIDPCLIKPRRLLGIHAPNARARRNRTEKQFSQGTCKEKSQRRTRIRPTPTGSTSRSTISDALETSPAGPLGLATPSRHDGVRARANPKARTSALQARRRLEQMVPRSSAPTSISGLRGPASVPLSGALCPAAARPDPQQVLAFAHSSRRKGPSKSPKREETPKDRAPRTLNPT
ncbi:hypothetical protein AJ87_16615 [Rhizobium yanglingense]|nr:hypothetical protein AJ87_16615 [Rhizobium yanglingense]